MEEKTLLKIDARNSITIISPKVSAVYRMDHSTRMSHNEQNPDGSPTSNSRETPQAR